jgi:hypothetical protein
MKDLASALQNVSEDDQADFQAEDTADNLGRALWADEKQDIDACEPWEGQTNDLGQWVEEDNGGGCWAADSRSCMQEKDDSEQDGRGVDGDSGDSLERVLETIKVASQRLPSCMKKAFLTYLHGRPPDFSILQQCLHPMSPSRNLSVRSHSILIQNPVHASVQRHRLPDPRHVHSCTAFDFPLNQNFGRREPR